MVKAQVKCYVAHSFKHRKFVKDILIPKVHAIGILTRNPFYEADGTTKRKEVLLADKAGIEEDSGNSLKDIDKEKWIRMIRKNTKNIVEGDLHYIDHTDFTIAYLTEMTAGTICEIFYTGVIKRRPVYLLTENPEVYEHPWILYSCKYGRICKSLNELIKVLKRKYG